MEPASKKITQEYFDSIVNENVNDFGMEPQEAIDDAISQLKAQGTDLSTICKFPQHDKQQLLDAIGRVGAFVKKLYPVNQEPAIKATASERNDKLGEPIALSDALIDECLADLEVIKATFDKDLSFRCLATGAKNGHNAYHMFLSYLNNLKYPTEDDNSSSTHEKIDKLTSSMLGAFQAYINQQSDVVDSSGLRTLIRLTASDKDDAQSGFGDRPVVLQSLLKCINTSCQMNESNRQFYVENGLCENLMQLFSKHKENDRILCDACQLIRSLLLDDDMRVEFGHAHEHAKYIASQLNGIDVLLQIGLGSEITLSEDTLSNIMLTLAKLAVRNEYCQEICDKGGLKFVLLCISEEHLKNLALLKSALGLLKSICNNDQVKHLATKLNGIELIKNVLEKYTANLQICELACAALAPLLLRNVEASEQLYAANCHQVLVQILNIHSSKPKLVKPLCLALRNSISRCRHLGEKLIELKIEETLNNIIKQNASQSGDEIKALLRDLGCHVELKEMWTGAGNVMSN